MGVGVKANGISNSTDRSKISSDHHRIVFDVSLYPFSFFVNTPFNKLITVTARAVLGV